MRTGQFAIQITEIADDHSRLGEQNIAKENVFANIENLKSELRDLNKKLKASDMKNQELQQNRAMAEEKCDLLETHLNKVSLLFMRPRCMTVK